MLDRGVLNRILQSALAVENAYGTGKPTENMWQDGVLECLDTWIEAYPMQKGMVEEGFEHERLAGFHADDRSAIVHEQLQPHGGMASRVPYAVCDLMESDEDIDVDFHDLVHVLSAGLDTYGIRMETQRLHVDGCYMGTIARFGSDQTQLLFVLAVVASGYRRFVKFVTFNTGAAAALMDVILRSAGSSGDDVDWRDIWTDGFVKLVKMADVTARSVIHVMPGSVDRGYWDSVAGVFHVGASRMGAIPDTLMDAIREKIRKEHPNDADSYNLLRLEGVWNVGTHYLWLARGVRKRNMYAFGYVVDAIGRQRGRDTAFMMAWNKRLGKDSVLGQLEPEIARQIVEDSAEQQPVAIGRVIR